MQFTGTDRFKAVINGAAGVILVSLRDKRLKGRLKAVGSRKRL